MLSQRMSRRRMGEQSCSSTRWTWVVNITPWLLYPRKITRYPLNRMRHCATSREVAGSLLNGINSILNDNPSSRTIALGSTQHLTIIFLGGKGGRSIGLTTLPLSCADCLYRGAGKTLPDQEGNKLQRQKILSFVYIIYDHNSRNICNIYIYIYIQRGAELHRVKLYTYFCTLLCVCVCVYILLLLVFSPWAGLGRDQSSVRRLVWLWYAASWASS